MPYPFLDEILAACPAQNGGPQSAAPSITGEGSLPSWFEVTDLAAATIGAAGLMLARYAADDGRDPPAVSVDRRLASFWFAGTIRPVGWEPPSPWDQLAGDYRAKDRWIKLHTNAPHHRQAALSVLGDFDDRAAVASAVARWEAENLEQAIVDAGGCAAAMLDLEEWSRHPQGVAVVGDPLICWQEYPAGNGGRETILTERPLATVKVLDLTRVLAGPVAGRFLAAFGAHVLRIDPPDWNEPGVVPEVTLGKRCARLDLKTPEGRRIFEKLLAEANILLHGYRPDALERMGFDGQEMRRLNPALIDVSLDAYGWSGPWRQRRGFDSLVQMSSGIADYGMRMSRADKPASLPVQALDMATGYLMAAAALHALSEQRREGTVLSAKLSLARTACLLTPSKRGSLGEGMATATSADLAPGTEETTWGPARRVRFPITISGMEPAWDYPARDLGWSDPVWA